MPQARSSGGGRSGGARSSRSSSSRSGSSSGGSARGSSSSRSGSSARKGTARKTTARKTTATKSSPRKSTASRSTARKSTARKATSSRASTARAGARGRTSARSGGADARFEAAAARVRKLNERIIEAGKDAGESTLTSYEKVLKTIASTIERGPGSSDIEWVHNLATAQAKFLRDLAT